MGVVRFGVSVNSDLLEKFDEVWRERGFANRSEAFRNLMREFIAKRELEEGKEVVGSLSLLYSYKASGVDYWLNKIEHVHRKKIISTMHIHLDEDHCLEILTIRGKGEEVRKIADYLISCKGVKQGKLLMTPVKIE